MRQNVSVALQYLDAWLGGWGAAAINSLMEDAATAEISRSQLWQWRHHGVSLADGRPMTAELYREIRSEEVGALRSAGADRGQLDRAAALLDGLVLEETFAGFLTNRAYTELD